MNNENNEGIIIEGGVETTWVRVTENSFPVELPVDLVNELTIVGGKNSGNYHIPTMKGLYIFIGSLTGAKHQGRIKVTRNHRSIKSGDYTSFYYDDGEVQAKSYKNGGDLTSKDIKKTKEFYLRNIESINMNSNSMKQNERIDDNELYNRIYTTELEYYKNGGR